MSCDRYSVDCGLAVLRDGMGNCRGWDEDCWELEVRVNCEWMKLSCDWEIGDFGEVDGWSWGVWGDVLYGFHFVKKVLKM